MANIFFFAILAFIIFLAVFSFGYLFAAREYGKELDIWKSRCHNQAAIYRESLVEGDGLRKELAELQDRYNSLVAKGL